MRKKPQVKWDGRVESLVDFWARVTFDDDGCWEYDATDCNGYGSFCRVPAHRYAYSIGRRLNPRKIVRHRCDNRACVRPSHLVQGTLADNGRDRAERGSARAQRRADASATPLVIYLPDGTTQTF